MAVTKSFANTLLTSIFASAYIGLSSTKPATDGTGVTEPLESAGYKRVASSGGSFSAMLICTSRKQPPPGAMYLIFACLMETQVAQGSDTLER